MRVGLSRRTVALAAIAGVSALALACSGGVTEQKADKGTPAGSPVSKATAASGGASAGGGTSTVAVELTEWGLKTNGAGKAGKVEFTAKNAGSTPHELVVLKTDADPAALTKNASGIVDEARHGAAGKTKQIADGQSEKLEATLTAGKYVLICNVAGHYDLGMRTAFTVN